MQKMRLQLRSCIATLGPCSALVSWRSGDRLVMKLLSHFEAAS